METIDFSVLKPSVESYYILDTFLIPRINDNTRCLEIGVGSGEIANLLSKFCKVFAVDVSEKCLERLGGKVCGKFKVNLEFEKIPVNENFFDVVICFAVLEHIKNYMHALKEIHRVLRPGGILIASTPNINWWPFRIKFLLGKCPEDFHTADHVNFWNIKRFRQIFVDSGFKVINQFTSIGLINIFYPFIKRYRKKYIEIYDKYIFIASKLNSKFFGYNQVIVAEK